mmetsp:Transcript_5724/g.18641  ORF Transcript_5724/g.18641 Transcript_5724/m.18641 type:complete len:209 (-) Transcript_5724:142-768(-)
MSSASSSGLSERTQSPTAAAAPMPTEATPLAATLRREATSMSSSSKLFSASSPGLLLSAPSWTARARARSRCWADSVTTSSRAVVAFEAVASRESLSLMVLSALSTMAKSKRRAELPSSGPGNSARAASSTFRSLAARAASRRMVATAFLNSSARAASTWTICDLASATLRSRSAIDGSGVASATVSKLVTSSCSVAARRRFAFSRFS